MLSGKRSVKISTKADKSASAKETIVVFNLDGVSDEDVLAMALQSAVIKLQGNFRKNGIPERFDVNLKDLTPGKRMAGPMTPEQIKANVSTMTPEQRAALLEMLQE